MATGPSIPYYTLKSRPDSTGIHFPSSTLTFDHTSSYRHNMHSKRRISIAKAAILASLSFMILALFHAHYSDNASYTSSETTSLEQQHQQQQHSLPELLPSRTPYMPGERTHQSTKSPVAPQPSLSTPTPVPAPAPDSKVSNESGIIVSDTALGTTVRYQNGTQTRVFKPAFFKDPEAAKNDMGSFMQTLAARSWWTRKSAPVFGNDNYNGSKSKDMNENEEEEDDDRDQINTSNTMPGRYFTYLPMGGGNNQFVSLQKAALLAKDLNRTLILPPISPNTHIPVWAGPRYSQFYDLDHFTSKSGISMVEWHDVKQVPESVPKDFNHHWEEFSEEFPCTPNGGIGIGNNRLYDKFRQQFLLKYKVAMSPVDKTQGKSTDYQYARDVLLKDTPMIETTKTANGVDPNLWKCLSCPYFLSGENLGNRAWDEVGVHLRFNDETEAMVDDILDILLRPVDGERKDTSAMSASRPFRPHPEFIIIHLRRGDIVNKCPPGVAEKDCVVQIEAIAEKVDEIEKQRRIAALEEHQLQQDGEGKENFVFKRLPVLVTTNEGRPEELRKLEKLGWILLDHGDEERDAEGRVKMSITTKLGTMSRLGPWYPPMLDAVLLTRGKYLIGMANSRMSILATQRGAAWHGHKTILM
ncbi:hypothetical protein BC939DRAFT_526135 [Gamsiella multidivaricata]|uniref:uncharacterized protein n=1 Tax=Gamsiella multidivaricata TaxID=101098 RepID=UPI002220AB8D|nr:uncharacterized protein BC939DRAFT_526135 [Gamsiella multidivaricata]KAG0365471.1 hypothetical protein BGZ54_006490 [Gamsiella multidivaricata]KAI7829642.1 hypothetical protein BC939DRAFT_526135 [Gamsiella multidivaricata]